MADKSTSPLVRIDLLTIKGTTSSRQGMGPRDARPRIRATVDSPRIRSEKRPGTRANHAIGPPAGIRYLSKRACLALPDGSCVDRHHGDQRARGDRYLGRPGGLGGAGAQGHAAAHSAPSARPSPAHARRGPLPRRAGGPRPGSGGVRQDLAPRAVASRKPRQRLDRALADGESGGRSAQRCCAA